MARVSLIISPKPVTIMLAKLCTGPASTPCLVLGTRQSASVLRDESMASIWSSPVEAASAAVILRRLPGLPALLLRRCGRGSDDDAPDVALVLLPLSLSPALPPRRKFSRSDRTFARKVVDCSSSRASIV